MIDQHDFLDDLCDPRLAGGCVLTIGNFDGVHHGHRTILAQVRAEADALGVAAAVLTFEPHPKTVFRDIDPDDFRITTATERVQLLTGAGADVVITAGFDPKFADLSPEGFVEALLIDRLHARQVHVGHDFNFGRDRAGDTRSLAQLTAPHGVQTVVHSPITDDDGVISSTRVRAAIRLGDLKTARALLTEPYRITGNTEAGAGRGKDMGIPTLNLYPTDRLLPPFGVYATQLIADGRAFQAISNLGIRPTFEDDDRVSLETLSLDPFDIEGRGIPITVRLIEQIRSERKFATPDALREQIAEDVADARRILDAED